MTKFRKNLTLIVIAALLLFVFTGCSFTEIKVFKAMMKTNEAKSLESTTSLQLKVDISNLEHLTEEERQEIQSMLYLLNNSSMTTTRKIDTSKDKLKGKGFVNLNINIAGMESQGNVWIDYDVSKDTPELKQVLELPDFLAPSLPQELMDKQYIVIDSEELYNQEGFNDDEIKELAQIIKGSKEIESEIKDFLLEFVKSFDFDKKVIKYKESKKIDGKSVKIYELKLDDKTFKNLLRESSNHLLEHKSTLKLVESLIKLGAFNYSDEEISKEDIDLLLDELSEETFPKLKEELNLFFDVIEDIQIVGDEGIIIEYTIDKSGYIIKQTGNIDLTFDLNSFENLNTYNSYENELENDLFASPEQTNELPIIDFNIIFETINSNINEKIDIEFPEINEENSVFYTDLYNI